jgi:hypothetical protein
VRAFGADDAKATCTPAAWMISLAPPPVPNPIPGVGHFGQASLGHSCRAPKDAPDLHAEVYKWKISIDEAMQILEARKRAKQPHVSS